MKLMDSPKIRAVLSQEIRTQMNTIVGMSFLLERSCSGNSSDFKYSEQIYKNCARLIRLFENYLDAEHTEQKNIGNKLERCNLEKMTEKIFSEFKETLDHDFSSTINLTIDNNCSNVSEVIIDKVKVSSALYSLFHLLVNKTRIGNIHVQYRYANGEVTFSILDPFQDYSLCKEYIQTDDIESLISKYCDTSATINIALAKWNAGLIGGAIKIEPFDKTGTGIHFSVPAKLVNYPTISANELHFCNIKY